MPQPETRNSAKQPPFGPLSPAHTAASLRAQGKLLDLKFSHREASIDGDELTKFCQTHGTTVQSVCVTVWLIVLYHMTGREDISLDLANHSTWSFLSRGERRVLNTTLTSATSPIDLLSSLNSFTLSSWEEICGNQCTHEGGGRHLFNVLDDEQAFQYELEKVASFEQNYISHAHLHMEATAITLRILWKDGFQDPDELTEIFSHIYAATLAQPTSSIRSIGIPSSNQLELSYSNQASTPTDPPTNDDGNLLGLIRRQSLKFPSRTAVHAWDGDLSYAELEAASDCWAKALTTLDLAAGEPVLHAFCHSRWAIVAWLSLLKAGCACVPIDTQTPEDRLKTIIDTTDCRAALCDRAGSALLGHTSLRLLSPDDLQALGKAADAAVHVRPVPRIAAIVYTSGSTGKPKGVVQTQGAIASSLVKVARALLIDEKSKLLQFASHCFDVSICEIFVTLVAGGCLAIPAPEDRVSQIARNINAMGVTHALLTPTVAKLLSPDQVPYLQSLSMGGERCSSILSETWSPHLQLNILYGTTESAVWDTINRVQSHTTHDASNIGYPIGNRLWVVHPGDWRALSPIGVPGELCIQGPEIADGYLGDPERTKRAFKTQPPWLAAKEASALDHNRIYRTGDLGRVLKDGSLQILGRIDRQIKLNGQRIEPGEVEEALKRFLPGQLEPFVDVLQPERGKARLAVFISHGDISGPASKQNSEHGPAIRKGIESTRALLPSSMIPSVIIPMTTFPLTPTKKIDRQELLSFGMEFIKSSQADFGLAPDEGAETKDMGCGSTTKVEDAVLGFLQTQQRCDVQDFCNRDFTIRDTGIDSLDAVALASILKEAAGLDISASRLLSPDVRLNDLKAISQQTLASEDPKSFLQEELHEWTAKLDKLSCDRHGVRSVLLTGANGFLGQEILHRLLKHKEISVICIVRGQDHHHARKRLTDTLRQTTWWNDGFEERVEIWPGDLAKSCAGLNEEQWRRVFGLDGQSQHVDVIIHNGALVHWLDPYESLRNTNVSSTYEFLRGCLRSRNPPRFFYVSGGYISGAEEARSELVDKICRLPAYDQTKFVSEVLVEHVQSMGSAVGNHIFTFKPGFVIGSTEDGRTQTGDALWRLVKACLRIRSYSQDDAARWIPVAGVDSIASILLDRILATVTPPVEGPLQKILDGVLFQEIWDALAAMDIHLKPMKHEDWRRSVQKDVEDAGQSHPLFPLNDWFKGSGGFMGIDPPPNRLISEEGCHKARLAILKSLEFLAHTGFLLDI